MENKKGFTLIELIAVIIILAIISTIAVAFISNKMEDVRKDAYKESVNQIVRSAQIYAGKNMFADHLDYPIIFTCDGSSCKNPNNEKLDFKGEVPKSGIIIVSGLNDVEAEYLSDGKHCASGKYGKINVAKTCGDIDHTKPTLAGVQNKKQVTITMIDNESGIDSYCLVKGNNECHWIKTNNMEEILELTSAGTWNIFCKDKKGNISDKLTYTTSQADYCHYETGSNNQLGDVLSYGGLDWYVLSDNGSTLTLVLKGNYTTGSYGTSTDFATSNVKTILNTNFVADYEGIQASIEADQLILNSNTNSYVRLLTKDEVTSYGSSIPNESETPYWTMTPDSTNVWYALADGATTYTKYTTTKKTVTCDNSDGWNCGTETKTYNALKTSTANTTAESNLNQVITSTKKSVSGTVLCRYGANGGGSSGYACQFAGTSSYNSYTTSVVKSDAGIRPVIEVKHCHLN